ncbi:MAG: hypothetical protein JXA77_10650 [Bacteroidales bacterium]|nr:hypothetical protein [Bacteroidales bacterium]MBN2820534.1 hypothetical protein [Bacteroidales bacterium]
MKRFKLYFLLAIAIFLFHMCENQNTDMSVNDAWNIIIPDTLSSTEINAICEYNDNTVWIGTNKGIWSFDNTSFSSVITTNDGLMDNEILDIKKNSMDEMIIFTASGINRYDGAMHIINTESLNYASYGYFDIDSDDNIWLLTDNAHENPQSLLKLNSDTETYYNPAGTSTDSENYMCVFADSKGRIWVGYYYQRIVLYKIENEDIDYFDTDELNEVVYAITEDSQENIWMTTDYSLVKFDGTSFTSYNDEDLFKLWSKNIIADHNDDIWVATHTKINKLHKGKWESEYVWSKTNPWKDPNSDLILYSKMMEDSKNNIWVCTDKGVMIKDNN